MKSLLLLLTASGLAWCGITVTAEAPGVQSTTVPSATVFTFNSLPVGVSTNISASFGSVAGTYDKLSIHSADIFGGANGSNYPKAALGDGVPSYTLTLNTAVNYIGIWWSAGDPSNQLDFYLGSTKVGTFTTSTALGVLPQTYYGNPNGGGDTSEAFAYLNFYGTGGTTFNKIVFTSTNDSGGFESDNHAIAVNVSPNGGLPISGTPTAVPALSKWALLAMALLLGASGIALSRKFAPTARRV